jgi:hypothetical protein
VKAEGYRTREETLAGWAVRVISYQCGDRFLASVENSDAGARIARAEGGTREEAEKVAIDKATERLARTLRRA